ncbi:hypothetical protein [Nonomuraea sp. NPDC050691]|uniref:hypothetical protein n=1 Tax=Nonomuraea sp. NPDC050691 TaxID=3155661 RepID=UPI0033F76D30
MTRASKRTPPDGATPHVLARSGGPLTLGAGAPAPPGMLRLTRPDSTGQALPVWPDGVTPALLEEHQVAPVPVERSGETRRVLAACLKCCWTDHSIDPWPGEPAPVELVLATYRALIGRTDDLMRNWAVGALRRLHDSAWVVMADGLVTLGPRCALWPVSSLAQLKELVRRIPEPERQELRVVADADIVAAARATTAAGADQGAEADQGAVPAEGELEETRPGDEQTEPMPAGKPAETLPGGEQPDTQIGGGPAEPESGGDPAKLRAEGESAEPLADGVRVTELPQAVRAAGAPATELPEGGLRAAGGRAIEVREAEARVTGARAAALSALGGRAEAGVADFDDLLDGYDERRRAELVAAYMVVEYAAEPVQEARFAALRDPALRHTLGEMLARRGRTLIQHRERWISGYSDEAAARALRQLREAAGPGALGRSGEAGDATSGSGAADAIDAVLDTPGDPRSSRDSGDPGEGTVGTLAHTVAPNIVAPRGGAPRLASAGGNADESTTATGTAAQSAGTATSPAGTTNPAAGDAPAGTNTPLAGSHTLAAGAASLTGATTSPAAAGSPAGAATPAAAATISSADTAGGAESASTLIGGDPGSNGASPGRARGSRGPVGSGGSNAFGGSNRPGGSTGLGGGSNRPGGSMGLGEAERAVLTLVLVHSVAIPRAEGVLPEDTWLSPHPTPVEELRRHTQVPIGELEAALRVLRHAGLLAQVKAGEEAGGYVPGPQFHRLTPAARRRLQEELILAAGPHTPLAAAVRARRSAG